jgi:hypothetical protein
LSSDVRPKKKQDTWTRADWQGRAATAFELSVVDLPQTKYLLVEGNGTIKVRDVERAF